MCKRRAYVRGTCQLFSLVCSSSFLHLFFCFCSKLTITSVFDINLTQSRAYDGACSDVIDSAVNIVSTLDECQPTCEPVCCQPVTCRLSFSSSKPLSFTKPITFTDSLGNRCVSPLMLCWLFVSK